MFFTNFMERAHNATFNHRPKAIYGVGMNRPDNIFARTMVNHTMIAPAVKVPIAGIIVGRDQADFLGNCLPDELIKGFGVNVVNDFRHNLTATAYGHNYRSFAGRPTATAAPLISMLVLRLPADKGFVNLYKAH